MQFNYIEYNYQVIKYDYLARISNKIGNENFNCKTIEQDCLTCKKL